MKGWMNKTKSPNKIRKLSPPIVSNTEVICSTSLTSFFSRTEYILENISYISFNIFRERECNSSYISHMICKSNAYVTYSWSPCHNLGMRSQSEPMAQDVAGVIRALWELQINKSRLVLIYFCIIYSYPWVHVHGFDGA